MGFLGYTDNVEHGPLFMSMSIQKKYSSQCACCLLRCVRAYLPLAPYIILPLIILKVILTFAAQNMENSSHDCGKMHSQ